MTEYQLACLKRAVNFARDRQIRKVKSLISIFQTEGWEKEEIDGALKSWSNYNLRRLNLHRSRIFSFIWKKKIHLLVTG